jgi:hypothetical protein
VRYHCLEVIGDSSNACRQPNDSVLQHGHFEQGVNPQGEPRSSKRSKTPSECSRVKQFTPNRGAHKAGRAAYRGLTSPPSSVPRHESPLFEPEPQHAQSAVTIQAEDLVDGEDDNIDTSNGDPLLESDLGGPRNASDRAEEAIEN